MRRWGILLLGLVALLMLFVISIPDSVRTISQDVRQNTASALTAAGFGTVNVAASGRILTLTGDVATEEMKTRAGEIAGSFEGVRQVNNQLTVVAPEIAQPVQIPLAIQKPYVINVEKSADGSVALSGFAPDVAARDDLTTTAIGLFGVDKVTGEIMLGAGMPDEGWIGAAKTGMTQLAKLDQGRARLSDRLLSLDGAAGSVEVQQSIISGLAAGMPDGYFVRNTLIAPLPVADPFRISATLDRDGKVVLSGVMPTGDAKRSYVQLARQTFGADDVSDQVSIARTVPDASWTGFAEYALGALSKMDDGRVILTGRQLLASGTVPNKAAREEISRILRQRTPTGYAVETGLTVPPPPLANPYTLLVEKSANGLVRISGQAPDEDTRDALFAAAKDTFGQGVINQINVASGMPDKNWPAFAAAGFDELFNLNAGTWAVTDQSGQLTGRAASQKLRAATQTSLQEGLADGYLVSMDVSAPAPQVKTTVKVAPLPVASPYKLLVEMATGGLVRISGNAPDTATRQHLLTAAEDVFGDGVIDQMTLAAGMPQANWPGFAVSGLDELFNLQEGAWEVTNQSGRLTGRAASQGLRAAASTSLQEGLQDGYLVSMDVSVPAPPVKTIVKVAPLPVASPYTLLVEMATNGLVRISGNAPDAATRQSLLTAAQDVFGDGVVDQMTLAAGMPQDNWPAFATSGLDELFNLEQGAWAVTDQSGRLTGRAATQILRRMTQESLREGVPGGYLVSAVISAPAPTAKPEVKSTPLLPLADPYLFVATKDTNGLAALVGSAPSDEARDEIVAAAEEAFGSGSVVYQLSLARGAPDDAWSEFATSGFDELSALEAGTWTVTGQLGQLVGSAPGIDDKIQVEDTLQIDVPEGYLVSSRVSAPAPVVVLIKPPATEVVTEPPTEPTPEPTVETVPKSVVETVPKAVVKAVPAPVVLPKLASNACRTNLDSYIVNQRILFATNLAEIRPDGRKVLDAVATLLRDCPSVRVEIAGHADARGTDAYNLVLSQRRADAVRDALADRNVGDDRLLANGYGETQPIADNSTAEGLARNRRIEFSVLRKIPVSR